MPAVKLEHLGLLISSCSASIGVDPEHVLSALDVSDQSIQWFPHHCGGTLVVKQDASIKIHCLTVSELSLMDNEVPSSVLDLAWLAQ